MIPFESGFDLEISEMSSPRQIKLSEGFARNKASFS